MEWGAILDKPPREQKVAEAISFFFGIGEDFSEGDTNNETLKRSPAIGTELAILVFEFPPALLIPGCLLIEMKDDLDHYTNTYHIYSKDLKNCQEFLGLPEVINWKQHLQIQSSQNSLNEVIQNLAATKSFKVKVTQNLLYMTSETTKELAPSLLDVKNLSLSDGKPKAIDQKTLKLSSMDPIYAALVNKFWSFGGNERSQRFIERCIRTLPNFCLLGPEGTPVSWSLMDHTGELRMAGTTPEYRAQGLITYLIYTHTQALLKFGFPVYSHVDRKNKIMQKMSHSLNHILMPCDWNQWNCVPL
ncbi:Glycine N-acyltransferase [Camelus dromedarius]|uniref:Glycine N-acyltransferase-like protein n=1 Tax=Camelus dromedarius TaxID=9838 RepID=A0A5N4DN78_CAMDR|nr:Glycine N-acyltransferase [Camelus dromedarius]